MRIEANPVADTRPASADQAKIREAATDFEALLIGQMLRSFAAESSALSGDPDASSSTMIEFAEQHLSRVMSMQGGLGLRDLIVRGLLRKEASAPQTQSANSGAVAAG